MDEVPKRLGGENSEARICWQCGETFSADLEYCPDDGAQLVELDPSDTKDILVGRVFDYRFRIIGKLGEGGMSRVYAARRLDGDGQVALKILKADFLRDPEVRKRFMYEARVISNLEHPNAVDLFDFGQAPDGSFYMVMELLQGESLADRLDGGALSYREIFAVVPPVCGVLAEAHEQDVIHRDLKPENIFLADMGAEEPIPKLLDFGIAKHLRSRTMTKNDQLWGTPAYMSPEQASGDPVAGTADIYAVGVMLYELVTGVLPFRASTAMGFAVKHMHREADSMTTVPGLEDVPEELDAFVLELLSKSPGDRPPEMGQVANRLREIERREFDSSLLEKIPAVQTNYSQLESPGGQEISADEVPPETAKNLTPEAIDERGRKIRPPEELEPPKPVKASKPSPPTESAGASDEIQTNNPFDGGMVDFVTGEEMVPWFRRTPAIVAAAVFATLGIAVLSFTVFGEFEFFGPYEAESTESAPTKRAESKESDPESVTRAAGYAASVAVRARAVANELGAEEYGEARESGDSELSEDDAEAAAERGGSDDGASTTFQLVPDDEEESGGSGESSAGSDSTPSSEGAAEDEANRSGEEGVDEALESTF